MRAPFGQKGVAASLAEGCGAGWDAPTWAEADFAAKAAALARPSAARISRRELMVHSFRSQGSSVEGRHEGVAAMQSSRLLDCEATAKARSRGRGQKDHALGL